MKIVFVNPPYAYAAQEKMPSKPMERGTANTFPVGLAILAGIARANGHDVYAVELPYLSIQEAEDCIVAKNPDVVALSCWTGNQRLLAALCSSLKYRLPRVKIVWGGHHATLFAKQVLEHYEVDFVVQGEGETPMTALLNELDGGPRACTPGLVRRTPDGIDFCAPRERLENLDALPIPAYDLFQIANNDGGEEKFGATPYPRSSKKVTLLASRGCPFKCTFCVDGKLFSKTVNREVVRVVDEIEFLVQEHNVRLFEFSDMTFTLSQKRTAELCREIIRRNLSISWQAMSRVNAVSAELLGLMRQSGCYSVSFGVETGSEALLQRIQKQITRAEIIRAFRQVAAAGLSTNMLLMVGNPGETEDTIRETIDLLYEALPTQIDPSIYQVYPGSATYRSLVESGYISDDYWLNNDAAPYFTGEHPYEKLKHWQERLQYHQIYRPRQHRLWKLVESISSIGRRRADECSGRGG